MSRFVRKYWFLIALMAVAVGAVAYKVALP
jgi:hypothetical protein